MRKGKMFLGLLLGLSLILAITGQSLADDEVQNPNGLVGRWEGWGGHKYWSSDFFFDIFAVDITAKKVYYRRYCPDCSSRKTLNGAAVLLDKKEKVIFGIAYGTFEAEFQLKGDKIAGESTHQHDGNTRYTDYTLKRVKKDMSFESKELIGTWRFQQDKMKWEIVIAEINQPEKSYKGKFIIAEGGNKGEYDISNGKFKEEGGKVSIEGKTLNNTLSFMLTGSSKFSDMPPALWGKADGKLDGVEGNVHYPLFEKK